MSKRRDSQIKAEKAYEAKRAKTPVGTRLDDEQLARFDAVRGDLSRSAAVAQALEEWIERNT